MGRTRKHQAQLIDHYETMKKVQRELEHKISGNNRSKQIMQESWDMGYHYDVTKERDEGNALHLRSARKVTSSGQEDGSKSQRVYLAGKTVGSSAFHGQESSLASKRNSLYELNSNEQSHEISDVLESLKEAKISLRQKINSATSIQTSSLVSRSEGSGMPVGSSSLFRLPADFPDDATARYNTRDSNFQFGLNTYPGRDTSRIFYDNVVINPYTGKMLIPAADRSLADRYMGTGSTFDTTRIPPHFPEEDYARFSSVDSTPVSSPNSSPGKGISETSGGIYNSSNSYLRYIQPMPTFDPTTLPPNFCEKVYARFNAVDSTPESSPNNSPGRRLSGTSGCQCSTIPSDDGSLSTMETGVRPDTEGSSNMDPPTFPISPSYETATHKLPIIW